MSAVLELRAAASVAFTLCDPLAKRAAVAQLQEIATRHAAQVDTTRVLVEHQDPGRPDRPVLVHPARVPRRRLGTPAGRAALIHALAHIEFNAINLALDAIARFPGLPEIYYFDWLKVAAEEAHHFELLVHRLGTLNHDYGDFLAHDGLWEVASKTRHDPLARMALVPRILEARGLDVTPGLQARLRTVGDDESAAILEIILRDEIGHVAIGNQWFKFLCQQRGHEPQAMFLSLCETHGIKPPHPPFNLPARLAAGFSEVELSALQARPQS